MYVTVTPNNIQAENNIFYKNALIQHNGSHRLHNYVHISISYAKQRQLRSHQSVYTEQCLNY